MKTLRFHYDDGIENFNDLEEECGKLGREYEKHQKKSDVEIELRDTLLMISRTNMLEIKSELETISSIGFFRTKIKNDDFKRLMSRLKEMLGYA